MPYTHYPKLEEPHLVILEAASIQDPRVTTSALPAGGRTSVYRHVVNFTRLYGSIWATAPIEVTIHFANDRWARARDTRIPAHADTSDRLDYALPENIRQRFPVSTEGLRNITDEDLPYLRYDALGTRAKYVPAADGKDAVNDKIVCTIYGVYMRLTVTNPGDVPITDWRVGICGSVF